VEINEELEEDTSLINTDPYDKGWILVIEAGNLDSELGSLMQGEALIDFIDKEVKIAEEEKAKA
jgi:glycine cleavage system H protein